MARLNVNTAQRRARLLAGRGLAWVTTGPGKRLAAEYGTRTARRVRVNLQPRRVWSFPHLLVLLWVVILLWGERWVFDSKVDRCAWDHWERWVGFLPPQPWRSVFFFLRMGASQC